MGSAQEWQDNERRIIEKFFERVPSSVACDEKSCIQFAHSILPAADDMVPVENQGSNSFTLISYHKSRIVQFRLQEFDTRVLDLAHKIYGDQVPQVVLHPGFPLPVYTSNIIPGKIFFLLDTPMSPFPLQRQLKTVADLGNFIAKATWYPQPHQPYRRNNNWTTSSREKIERLLNNSSFQRLAPELVPLVQQLHSNLHLLDLLPRVLTHHDLAEINILVDDHGHVTGVIDFDQADIEALGMCIWGVYEGFLGTLSKGRWSFFDQDAAGYPGRTVRQVLETTFWSTFWSSTSSQIQQTDDFKEAVKVAARIGVIHRYFVRGMLDEIRESDRSHCYSLEYARGILPSI